MRCDSRNIYKSLGVRGSPHLRPRGSPARVRGNPQAVARGGRDYGTPLAVLKRHGWAGRLGEDVARGYGRVAGVGDPTSRAVRRSKDMRTTSHSSHSLGLFVGVGLMLVSLFGSLTCPAESVAGVEPTAYWDNRGDWDYRGPSDYRDHRSDRRHRDHWDDWSYGRPGSALPDRYTIQKGKKCELQCERIRGTREYRCREYRC
jgi:hypothetical protein